MFDGGLRALFLAAAGGQAGIAGALIVIPRSAGRDAAAARTARFTGSHAVIQPR